MTNRSIRRAAWTITLVVIAGGLALFFYETRRASGAGESLESELDAYKLQGDTIHSRDDALGPAGIQIAKVEARDVPMTLTLTAKSGFNMETVTHVSALFGGRVTNIEVGLGDTVKGPGEPGGPTKLCVIESNDLAQAKANWLQALIQVKIDELALKRAKDLFVANVLAEKFLIDAESQLLKDQSAEEAARQQLLIFGLNDNEIDDIRKEAITEAENMKAGSPAAATRPQQSVEEIRRQRMGYVLTSPRSGVIAEKFIAGGENVVPQTNLFTVADTHTMWVWGDVYERDLPYVKVGQPMKVYFTSDPDHPRQCTVNWISPVLDPNTHSIKVRGLLDNSDGRLLSDMYGTMVVTVETGKHNIIVPADAVVRQDEDAWVFVQIAHEEGSTVFKRTPVKLQPVDVGFGASAGNASSVAGSAARTTGTQQNSPGLVRVVEGLSPGDLIVISGGVGLFNEMKEQSNVQQAPVAPAH